MVLIDGEPGDGTFSVFDDGLLRGDGCFEAVRSYNGRPFAWEEHYLRLTASAGALGIPVPAATDLDNWVGRVAEEGGDCIVRVVLTRGGTVPGHALPSRCIVMSHPVPMVPAGLSLFPVRAPWHPAGRPWELSGVKTLSYAPNSRQAGWLEEPTMTTPSWFPMGRRSWRDRRSPSHGCGTEFWKPPDSTWGSSTRSRGG